jgi:hypothetical protein
MMRQEAELMQHFSGSYRQKIGGLIQQLNAKDRSVSVEQCLHVCVEALDMLLVSHARLCQAMEEMVAAEQRRARSSAMPSAA